METPKATTLDFVKIFARAIRDMVGSTTGRKVSVAKSAMKIDGVQIAGDIGAFVAMSGDYSGIMILNFEGPAALEVTAGYLTMLGLPESDIPSHFQSDDVRNNIGELTNQIIGKCRTMVQDTFDLSAKANIPAVVPITVPIALNLVAAKGNALESYRVPFTTETRNKFYMELAIEPIDARDLGGI